MPPNVPAQSVWSAMTYTPPRGRCNYKNSLLGPACPCLRFMLHPVKAATSFECDGCNHHASFHSLENPAEDAILKKWEAQEQESEKGKAMQAIAGVSAAKKRKRVKEKAEEDEVRVVEILDVVEEQKGAEGMLERTMAIFGGGGGAALSSPRTTVDEEDVVRTKRPRRGRKGVD